MEASEVREVKFEDALAEEEQAGGDEGTPRPRPPHAQTPQLPESETQPAERVPESETQLAKSEVVPQPPTQDESAKHIQEKREELEEELEDLEPPVPAKEWTFGEGDLARTYIQSELSVIGSAQWFKLLGEVLEDAMTGDDKLSLGNLLSPPQPGKSGQFNIEDFQEADMFVLALGKLLTVMPEFMEKSIFIWLDIPDYEQELVGNLMRRSPTQGGMSHDTFEGILSTFIDQNFAEIDRFFRERYPRLRNRVRARAKEASQSRSQRR